MQRTENNKEKGRRRAGKVENIMKICVIRFLKNNSKESLTLRQQDFESEIDFKARCFEKILFLIQNCSIYDVVLQEQG